MGVRDPMQSGPMSWGSSSAADTGIAAALAGAFALGTLALVAEPAPETSPPAAERSPQVWSLPAESVQVPGEHGTPSRLGADPRSEPFVSYWRDRLTQSPPGLLRAYLSRPRAWEAELVPVLAEHSVPAEFLYLALVESGMDPDARSPAQAVGLWQLTEATARQYGLIVDGDVDERLDHLLSTYAAGRYLRDLHRRFGSWELAAAAFNAGPGRVERALTRAAANSYWDLIEIGYLPAETRDYVPRLLATVQLANERRDVIVALPTAVVTAD